MLSFSNVQVLRYDQTHKPKKYYYYICTHFTLKDGDKCKKEDIRERLENISE